MQDKSIFIPMAEEATVLLKALAHPARLMICCQLRQKEMSVSEIEKTLNIRQPRLSRELGKLREEGFIEARRVSKSVFYSLSQKDHISELIDAVCDVFLDPAIERNVTSPTSIPTVKASHASGCGVFATTTSIPKKGSRHA